MCAIYTPPDPSKQTLHVYRYTRGAVSEVSVAHQVYLAKLTEIRSTGLSGSVGKCAFYSRVKERSLRVPCGLPPREIVIVDTSHPGLAIYDAATREFPPCRDDSEACSKGGTADILLSAHLLVDPVIACPGTHLGSQWLTCLQEIGRPSHAFSHANAVDDLSSNL